MTKKDYNILAPLIKNSLAVAETEDARQALTLFASSLSFSLLADNARFDRSRFLLACGITK